MSRRVGRVGAPLILVSLVTASAATAAGAPARDLALAGKRHLDAGEIPEARAALHAAREAFEAEEAARNRTPDAELADYLGLNLYNLGVRLNNDGDPAGALDTFDDALRVMRLAPRMRDDAFRSRMTDAALSVAAYLVSTGVTERPVAVYQLLADLMPGDARPLIGLGEVRLSVGDLDGAAVAFDRAWRVGPNDAEAVAGRGATMLRRALAGPPGDVEPGDLPEEIASTVLAAADLLRQARDLDPTSARERELAAALQQAAPALGRAGRAGEADACRKEAESSLRRAVILEPDSPWALMDLAMFVFKSRRYEEAAALLERAAEMFDRMRAARPGDRNAGAWAGAQASCRDNRATAMYNLAVDALNRADFSRADAWLARACAAGPHWERTCEAFRGAAGVRRRAFEESIAVHEEALAAEPDRAVDLLALGDLYAEIGSWEKAGAYYTRLRAIDAGVPGLADRLAAVASPPVVEVRTRVVEVPRERVSVSYAGEEPGAGFDTAIKAARLRVGTDLGNDAMRGDLSVLVYPNKRSFREEAGYRVGSLVKGYYGGGRISLYATPSTTTVEWVSTLTHEMAHHAAERLSGGRAPKWLCEGVARYVEGDAAVVDRARVKARLEAGALEPLGRLDDRMDKAWNDPDVYHDVRDMALLAVEEMSRRGGMDAIRSLLVALAAGKDTATFDDAMKRAFSAGLSDIDAAWRAALLHAGR